MILTGSQVYGSRTVCSQLDWVLLYVLFNSVKLSNKIAIALFFPTLLHASVPVSAVPCTLPMSRDSNFSRESLLSWSHLMNGPPMYLVSQPQTQRILIFIFSLPSSYLYTICSPTISNP